MTKAQAFTPPGLRNTAVLFLVFNRPDTTRQVFEAIRQARPPRLYVAADGPRPNRPGEAERCAEVRRIATNVDWPCEVKTLFRDENLGCKRAVSGGITWFFENEEQGIILEDDCLPHPDFFPFCEELLQRYANDERVWTITGCNFQDGHRRGDASYYFSKYNHVWGWASWRRAWRHYQGDIPFWPAWRLSKEWTAWMPDKVERRYWDKVFDVVARDGIDTWDYPWTACVWYHRGLTATPNVNLISNIGFGVDGTHAPLEPDRNMNRPTMALGAISHPPQVQRDADADSYVFDVSFGGREMRFPRLIIFFLRRILKKAPRVLRESA